MKRILTIAMLALVGTGSWAESELASLRAGQSVSGEWTARAAFVTGEYEWEAEVRIEGPGTLTLCYPGDGRMALKRVEGPTEEPQTVRLHMRANPDADGNPTRLPVRWTFEAEGGPATCWLTPSGGAPMPDDFAMQPKPLYQHEIPRVTEPPVIDGDLSDACWDENASIGDAYWGMYNQPGDARMATHVWCAYDDENLYAAFRCETPDVSRLVTKITERDGYAWRDDSAEIFFDIGHDHNSYYEYIVTPNEVVFDSKWFYEGGQWLTDWDYIGEWKTSTEPGAWIVEIRLSLESYEKRDLRG
ncbi:MAG: sugar-binding protein, partial [Armatimonadota bacterium]